MNVATTASKRLLVSARVDPLGGEVTRGMPVLVEDGTIVGAVAAVVQTGADRTVTHLLLGQIPPTAEYRLIPLGLLDRLDGDGVCLRASRRQVLELPSYESED